MPTLPEWNEADLYAAFVARATGHRPAHADTPRLEANWETWVTTLFPEAVKAPFAPHHRRLWEWAWSIELGTPARPFVAIWPRGGAKSSSAELVCAALGALGTRRYVLYVSATQDLADKHVADGVAGWIEKSSIGRYYPGFGDRAVGKFGSVKGWRRNRLRTASGFTIDAAGLDTAIRGLKVEDQRPDLIVFDDIDHIADSLDAVEKKIRTLTQSILPAGSTDLAVLAVQNLIHADSIFSRLAGISEHTADFLANRILEGPYPAVEDLTTITDHRGRTLITGGRPIWQGQDLADCQHAIDTSGITAFLQESQQLVEQRSGDLFSHLHFDAMRCQPTDVPRLLKVEVWCDPAVTDTDKSDSHGIQVDGIGVDRKLYRLWSWEKRKSPNYVISLAIAKALEFGATHVGVETNQGGDLWRSTFDTLITQLQVSGLAVEGEIVRLGRGQLIPKFKEEKADASTGGKTHRATHMLAEYERGAIVHVEGTHDVLERALRRFPETKPFDLVDAATWSFSSLTGRLASMHGNRTAVSAPRPTFTPR